MNRRLLLGEVLKYKLPVGFEYEVPYTELTAGQLIRDGSLVDRNTYSELWKFVEAHPSMLVNDDKWLATLTANEGLACNYYSTGDNSTTFRLPKAGTIVLPNSDPSKINTYSTDIQRNITGSITMIDTMKFKSTELSDIIIEGKSCDTPERLEETLSLSDINVHDAEYPFGNYIIKPRKGLALLSLTYADHQLTTAKSFINTMVLTYMNKLTHRYTLYLDINEKLYFRGLIQKINKHLHRIIGDLISPKIVSNCLPTINLEDKFSKHLYRSCPGKHFFYEVSKDINLITDSPATELDSSSVISPNGQPIPIYDLLFGKIPGCKVEKLSEHSYQATVTIPMPDSVKIDIGYENNSHPPECVVFTAGQSIDLNDIADEINITAYTFSQPNYLRDIQDSWEHPEPSTESLLAGNLDQLMRYSRLSEYRGDHFVNN